MSALALGAKAQEVHQRPSVHGHIHARVNIQWQNNSCHFPCDPGFKHALIRLVSRYRCRAGFLLNQGNLLGGAWVKFVVTGFTGLY